MPRGGRSDTQCRHAGPCLEPLRAFAGIESLAEALDSLAIISATDRKGRILFANEAFEKICGYQQSELLGNSHNLINSGYHSTDFFKDMWRTLAEGKMWRGEIRNRAKNGSLYWVDTAIVPFRDVSGSIAGYTSARIDITARKTAEERLKAENVELSTQLQTALDSMGRGLCMFDADARLILSNGAYREIYGLPEHLTRPGTTLSEIISHYVTRQRGLQCEADTQMQDQWIASQLAELAQGKTLTRTQTLENGHTIQITTQPVAGGKWVELLEDITERLRSQSLIFHLARHDSLTNLPNRAYLSERLIEALAETTQGSRVAVLLLNLDRFKTVNDLLGHTIGDELLKMVAYRLNRVVRKDLMIARMGGDEFAVLQKGLRSKNEARALAQRLIRALSEPYVVEGHTVVVGVSVGISIGPTDSPDGGQLLKNADLALSKAKEGGRGKHCFFEPELDSVQRARHQLEIDLRTALATSQFELHYQPLVRLDDEKVVGAEALIRWNHPVHGLISPAKFIPLAEETRLIVPIGSWIIRHACATAAKWPDHVKIAVNLSALQFERPGLYETIASALAETGLRPWRLELEITESVLLNSSETVLKTLHKLHALGVRIALDDFGTGFSSLSYLQKFPFDKLKIDQSFIRDFTRCSEALKIVRAIVNLAKSLGMTTTAEGIEAEDQLKAARLEGCDEIQGYLIGRPQKAVEISARLEPPARSEKRTKAAGSAATRKQRQKSSPARSARPARRKTTAHVAR